MKILKDGVRRDRKDKEMRPEEQRSGKRWKDLKRSK